MTVRHPVLVALLALTVTAAAGAGTYALWRDPASAAGGVVTNGDLRIALVGAPAWTETSPDVTPAHPITSTAGTADHLATAGDTYTLTQQFTLALDGDNLAARLAATWTTPPTLLPAGALSATYVVTSPPGAAGESAVTTTPRPLGTAVTIPEGLGANLTPAALAAWADQPWTLTVTLVYDAAAPAVVVAPGQVGASRVTGLGTVALELRQVRDGDGFTP